ncbi:MAG TPA: hypothetical protein VFV94_19655 [Polyangiaceae bacterium]|nr:hypothetical protein [Polyangiaceae bacterium]
MTELRPLIESSESSTTRELLRSGLGDAPPPEAMGRAAVALGLTATAAAFAVPAGAAALNGAAVGGLGAASKAGGVTGILVGKWLASGLVAGALVSGTAAVVEHVRARAEERPPAGGAPSTAREARSGASTPHAVRSAEPGVEREPEPAEPEPPRVSSKPALPGQPSGVSSAGAAPDSSTSRALGAEAARIDAARRALGRGDVRRALIELDWYERSRVVGVLDREAQLLRIQAHVRAGDGARAVELARGYLAKHPQDAYAARLSELIRKGGAIFPENDGINR